MFPRRSLPCLLSPPFASPAVAAAAGAPAVAVSAQVEGAREKSQRWRRKCRNRNFRRPLRRCRIAAASPAAEARARRHARRWTALSGRQGPTQPRTAPTRRAWGDERIRAEWWGMMTKVKLCMTSLVVEGSNQAKRQEKSGTQPKMGEGEKQKQKTENTTCEGRRRKKRPRRVGVKARRKKCNRSTNRGARIIEARPNSPCMGKRGEASVVNGVKKQRFVAVIQRRLRHCVPRIHKV